MLVESLPRVAELPGDCWLVGGCVRDAILKRSPRDVDCAAPHAGEAADAFASRTGGRKICLARKPLETWRVVLNGLDWDFTDFDGGSIECDLGRRDFAIGALALSVRSPHELRDPSGGFEDLRRRTVRMVSASNIVADPVRMIRAVRIAARLGFDIEDETSVFIEENAARIRESASERITIELDEIVAAREVRKGLELLVRLKLDREVLPDAIDEVVIDRCSRVSSPDVVTRYAALFAGIEDRVAAYAERARWSVERRRSVSALLRFVAEAADEMLPLLVHDHGTRCARRAAELLAAMGREELASRLTSLVQTSGATLENMRPLLDGDVVRELLGIEDGPELGRLLRSLLEEQIRGGVRTRSEAESFVTRLHGASK